MKEHVGKITCIGEKKKYDKAILLTLISISFSLSSLIKACCWVVFDYVFCYPWLSYDLTRSTFDKILDGAT